MRIFVIVILTCLLFSIAGCDKHRIEIVEGDSALVPTFKTKISHVIDSVEVLEKNGSTWDYSRPVWSLYAKRTNQSPKIKELKYGEVPYAFDEIHKAKELEYGKTYRIFIRRGDVGISAYFIITTENGLATIKQLDTQ